jgi:hypothetical protein
MGAMLNDTVIPAKGEAGVSQSIALRRANAKAMQGFGGNPSSLVVVPAKAGTSNFSSFAKGYRCRLVATSSRGLPDGNLLSLLLQRK